MAEAYGLYRSGEGGPGHSVRLGAQSMASCRIMISSRGRTRTTSGLKDGERAVHRIRVRQWPLAATQVEQLGTLRKARATIRQLSQAFSVGHAVIEGELGLKGLKFWPLAPDLQGTVAAEYGRAPRFATW